MAVNEVSSRRDSREVSLRSRRQGLSSSLVAGARTRSHLLWLAIGVVVTVLGFVFPIQGTTSIAVSLSTGVFSGLVTAVTFALVLTIQQAQAWPSATAVIRDSGAFAWLMIAVGSLATSALASITSLAEPARLATASMWLSLLSLVVGIWNVIAILGGAGGPGQHRARVRILTRDLVVAERSNTASGSLQARRGGLAEFLVNFQRAVDAEDLAAIRAHTAEIIAAGHTDGARSQAAVVSTHLRMAAILGGEMLRGNQPIVAVAALEDLLQGAVDFAGRTLDAEQTPTPSSDGLAERRAVLVLGETTRLAAFISKVAWQRYFEYTTSPGDRGFDDDYAARLMITCHQIREQVRFSVDPDPPEKYLKSSDPWLEGVHDPESILLWLWAHSDFDGTNQGSGLYSVYEVLTGDKYFGTVYGGTSVISDLIANLGDAGRHGRPEIPPQTVRTLRRYGGPERIFREIATNSIAQLKPRVWEPPRPLRTNNYFDPRPEAKLRNFVPLATTEEDRPRDVDMALDHLADLLSPTPNKFSAFAVQEFGSGTVNALPSERSIGSRPPAAVIAVGLSLLNLNHENDEGAQRARLGQFLDRLPAPLLDGTAHFGDRICGRSPRNPEESSSRLIEQLTAVWRA